MNYNLTTENITENVESYNLYIQIYVLVYMQELDQFV